MKKGAGVYSLNRVPISLNWGSLNWDSLNRVSGVPSKKCIYYYSQDSI